MELGLPLEVSPGREATCRAVFGTWGFFPDDARASHCPFVLTSYTGWSSKRCPGIGFLSRGDREIGVLRNVEADSYKPSAFPTRPPPPTTASTFKNTGQTKSVIFFWKQHWVSQMDFIWQLKGVNICLDSEVPLDNGYKMLATVS